MKRIKKFLAILAGVSLILLMGCGIKLGEEFTEEVNMLEGAEITVDEALVTPTGITFTINNQSDKDLSYGQDYSLQKEEDGKWYWIEPENPAAVTLELLWIPAGNADTMEISWETSYGKLPKGHYRILKNMADEQSGYYLAGEFGIE